MRTSLALLAALSLVLALSWAPLTAHAGRPIPAHVQVLIVGGSPAGIAAAVAAARAGMTTLLVEPREEIGGDITLSWLNMLDLNHGPSGEELTRGIFGRVHRELGQTFDVDHARAVFDALVRAQPTLTVATRTRVAAPIMRGRVLTGVVLITERGRQRTVTADEFIDATDDASLAISTRVPFTVGREESRLDRRMQAATLVVRLAGIDYDGVRRYIRKVKGPDRIGGVDGRYAWGYGEIVRQFRPRNTRVAAYDLNLGWQSDGTVLVNSVHVFDVDGADARSLREARAQTVAELPQFMQFLRTRAPGFANAYLVGAAPNLYVRETRHLACLYRMDADDILEGHDFWDRVAIASYPIDLHPYIPGQMNPYRVSRRVYAIPFRILVPRGVDRLMVVGKPVGATYIAAGSLRVIPTGMAMGEAAGEAAAIAVRAGTTPMRMAQNAALIAHLQRRLVSMGAYLPSPELLSAPWRHPHTKTASRPAP